jgi:2-polyprenyl-3-methyl-5-hydroxy-6-metoxy-1,4-benzoquinol methylase
MATLLKKHLKLFICPACQSSLKTKSSKTVYCLNNHQYPIREGIPLLFIDEKNQSPITNTIKQFYEKTPFPNYDHLETPADLIQKSKKGIFAKKLDEQIPFNINILEVGCGTGQLSNFLSLSNRNLLGVDASINSLKLAHQFKKRHNLKNAEFFQMNLFKPCFKPESFPLVICTGVLHHTPDPFKGFQSISKLVKPGGYIIIGLYHHYGRLATQLRRLIFKLTKNRFLSLDPILKTKQFKDQHKAWLQDQYYNPHESTHSLSEVFYWLKKTNFEFINSLPQLNTFSPLIPNNIFSSIKSKNWLDHLTFNLKMISSCSREGGLFIIIARKST